MKHLYALPSATLLIAALLLTAPVEARSDGQSASPQAAETDADGVTTGSIGGNQAEKRKKQFDDCMAIWDPGTHMTKRQWRRTCTNTLDELPNL